jgi:hypothetical protein
LLAEAGKPYARMLIDAGDDAAALLVAEQHEFGVTHAVYGNALCASWGLANEVIRYVRERVAAPDTWLALPATLRKLLLLGHVAEAVVAGADPAEQCRTIAPDSGWSAEQLQAAVVPAWARLSAARRA